MAVASTLTHMNITTLGKEQRALKRLFQEDLQMAYNTLSDKRVYREETRQISNPTTRVRNNFLPIVKILTILNINPSTARKVSSKMSGVTISPPHLLVTKAISTGYKAVSENAGFKLQSLQIDMFGQAKRITITKDSTALIAESNEIQS